MYFLFKEKERTIKDIVCVCARKVAGVHIQKGAYILLVRIILQWDGHTCR